MTNTFGTPRYVSIFATAAALAAAAWAAPAASAAPAQQAFALSNGNLVTFDPAAPATTTSKPITGVTAGETLVGLDVRPQNGQLYALGVNAGADTATLYVVGRTTGVAGVVGAAPSSIAFVPGIFGTTDLPEGDYGFDFNPTVDRIRVTTASGLNFRVNPVTGGAVDGDNGGG
ncbi:MAG: DUF4394 domain-containing protein, partial [Solirubrobacteraceae bacterium]|nr:DUF4394 domain-containing protein [Solirubrobacteraceae bacterium]